MSNNPIYDLGNNREESSDAILTSYELQKTEVIKHLSSLVNSELLETIQQGFPKYEKDYTIKSLALFRVQADILDPIKKIISTYDKKAASRKTSKENFSDLDLFFNKAIKQEISSKLIRNNIVRKEILEEINKHIINILADNKQDIVAVNQKLNENMQKTAVEDIDDVNLGSNHMDLTKALQDLFAELSKIISSNNLVKLEGITDRFTKQVDLKSCEFLALEASHPSIEQYCDIKRPNLNYEEIAQKRNILQTLNSRLAYIKNDFGDDLCNKLLANSGNTIASLQATVKNIYDVYNELVGVQTLIEEPNESMSGRRFLETLLDKYIAKKKLNFNSVYQFMNRIQSIDDLKQVCHDLKGELYYNARPYKVKANMYRLFVYSALAAAAAYTAMAMPLLAIIPAVILAALVTVDAVRHKNIYKQQSILKQIQANNQPKDDKSQNPGSQGQNTLEV